VVGARVDIARVERDIPVGLEAHHLLEPHGHRREREIVRGQVIHARHAEAVLAPARHSVPPEVGHHRRIPRVLHEPKQRVAEGGRDVEPGDRSPVDVFMLHSGDVRGAAPGQERIGTFHVRHLEHDPTCALRVLLEPLEALALRAERLHEDEARAARLHDARARSVLRLELGRTHGRFGEIKLVHVVVPAALEVPYEHVHRGDALNAK